MCSDLKIENQEVGENNVDLGTAGIEIGTSSSRILSARRNVDRVTKDIVK